MEYTFEEFKKLKEEHNKHFNVQTPIAANDVVGAVEAIKQSMLDNPDMQVFTLTRPLVTLETFQSDLKLFNHLYRNCKDMIFTFLPETGYFVFSELRNQKKISTITSCGKTKKCEIIVLLNYIQVGQS